MSALLTRSTTLGSDGAVNSRQVCFNSCFLQKRERLADYERDYLLPAPSSNCNGFLHAELRCDSAFAMQNRVLYSLLRERTSVFPKVSTTFWTPHSARAFMPSSTKTLGVAKEERGYLGGWSARAAARRTHGLRSVSYPTFKGSSSEH